mmetsp:Transcript_44804/g.124942  ORF Transcript_44804/g.124942 Transcript_44804/m.124942 type:complete len:93 (-) Transcript_44804:178-456(-)
MPADDAADKVAVLKEPSPLIRSLELRVFDTVKFNHLEHGRIELDTPQKWADDNCVKKSHIVAAIQAQLLEHVLQHKKLVAELHAATCPRTRM